MLRLENAHDRSPFAFEGASPGIPAAGGGTPGIASAIRTLRMQDECRNGDGRQSNSGAVGPAAEAGTSEAVSALYGRFGSLGACLADWGT
jgi:hypothetical protein